MIPQPLLPFHQFTLTTITCDVLIGLCDRADPSLCAGSERSGAVGSGGRHHEVTTGPVTGEHHDSCLY